MGSPGRLVSTDGGLGAVEHSRAGSSESPVRSVRYLTPIEIRRPETPDERGAHLYGKEQTAGDDGLAFTRRQGPDMADAILGASIATDVARGHVGIGRGARGP